MYVTKPAIASHTNALAKNRSFTKIYPIATQYFIRNPIMLTDLKQYKQN